MKAKQIRQLTSEERGQKLHELREELFKLRFQAGSGQLEKTARIGEVKRDIARFLTIEKEEKK
ncbi:MAG TPA: 50S ribosomal protein L29 [bacterium]|nr:50S ribosomal protein L29 [bacterium]HPQ65966.1 50S ribosomal protein L29 [bacterium]